MTPGIAIELVVDADGAVRSIRTVDGTLVNLTRTAEQEGGRFGGAIQHFLGGLALSAVRRLMGSLGSLKDVLFELATDAEETADKFRVVFEEEAGAAVSEFLELWANLAGLTKTEGKEMAATLGSIFQGFGFGKQQSAGLSISVLKLAGDLQSLNNVPITQTLAAIRSGLAGQREPLDRFGAGFTAVEVKMRAAALTGKSVTASFTQQEIVAARLSVILEKTKLAHGNLADTADSTANTTRRAYARLKERAEELAQTFLPIFGEMAKTANAFLDANNEAITGGIAKIGDMAVVAFRIISEFIGILIDGIRVLHEYKGVTQFVVGILGAYVLWVGRATIAQRLFNLATRANIIGALITAILLAIGAFRRYRANALDAGAATLEWISSTIEGLKDLGDWLIKVGAIIPRQFGGGAILEAGVKLNGVITGATDKMRGWAEGLRESAAAARQNNEEQEVAVQATEQHQLSAEELTKILQEQAQAQTDNADAHKKAAKAMSAAERAALRLAEAMAFAKTLSDPFLRALELSPRTISEAESKLSMLQLALNHVDTQEARDEILAYISILEALIQKMRGVQLESGKTKEKTETDAKDSKDTIAEVADGIGDQFLNLAEQVASGQLTMRGAVAQFVGVLASMGMRVGKILIASGSGIEALKKLSGPAAIIAGGLLIAASLAARAAISREVNNSLGGSDQPASTGAPTSQVPIAGFRFGQRVPGITGPPIGNIPSASTAAVGPALHRMNTILSSLERNGIRVEGKADTPGDKVRQVYNGRVKTEKRLGYKPQN